MPLGAGPATAGGRHRGGSVGLVMIAKNEATNLPRLAASLTGQIDHRTLVDTGSTDSTIRVATEVFSDIPGQVVKDLWRATGRRARWR